VHLAVAEPDLGIVEAHDALIGVPQPPAR
jgi:hypothetical protein